MNFAQLDGVEPGNLRDFLTLTLVLGLAVLQILTFLKKQKSPEGGEAKAASPQKAPEFVERDLCFSMHAQTDHRLKRLEAAEQAMRVELADIRREMKLDREAMQTVFRAEIGKVHERLNDVFVCVAELRGTNGSGRPKS